MFTGKSISRFLHDILDFLFPRYCIACASRLYSGEHMLCSHCLLALPWINDSSFEDNKMIHNFWGIVPIEKGTSCFFYEHESTASRILHKLKYCNRPDVGVKLGRIMAKRLVDRGFFSGIDYIVPIPLSAGREKQRGYNQSERLAFGLSSVTGIPLCCDVVKRVKDNPSQTKLDAYARRENVRSIFEAVYPGRLDGKHILIVDDVMTTGSTMLSCAETICSSHKVRISILTLARVKYS